MLQESFKDIESGSINTRRYIRGARQGKYFGLENVKTLCKVGHEVKKRAVVVTYMS